MQDSKGPRPLVDDLFEVSGSDGQPHLIVSRCTSCDTLDFPPRQRCSRCFGKELETEEAPSEGTLYTFTVIRELGKQREGFIPYAVGQVDLANGVRVTGVVAAAPDSVSIGMPLRMTVLPQGKDEDGNVLLAYAFAAAGE
jgi:uncharacterized OB-fold protein